jgi:D-sedoheptulose 7-phosphate isomerase
MDSQGYIQKLFTSVGQIEQAKIANATQLVKTAWENGRQVFCLGNGGSALAAKHFITDWNKAVYLHTGKPFLGYSLADNIGLFSAYANDLSYDEVFSAQLQPLLKKDDLVIGISGSGNSKNVIRAIEYANTNGGITLGLCGYDGGQLKQVAQHHVWVPINDMQITEDVHLIIGHMIMQSLLAA